MTLLVFIPRRIGLRNAVSCVPLRFIAVPLEDVWVAEPSQIRA